MKRRSKIAVIIGGGPAGLTAAYELLTKTEDIKPIVIEKSNQVGGISKTVNYRGNRIDIGGHRFFSKSDRVIDWWLKFLPLQSTEDESLNINYQSKSHRLKTDKKGPNPLTQDEVMLIRKRRSRIFYNNDLYPYPIKLSSEVLLKLGLFKTIRIGITYIHRMIWPIKPEDNLEQFFLNRFGGELYNTFFKTYTQKVWGVPPSQIDAEWGAQRVKGLSIKKAIIHAIREILPRRANDLKQKSTETSLIERFMYPKYGPGQLWEKVESEIKRLGGEVILNATAEKFVTSDQKVTSVTAKSKDGKAKEYKADFVFSTMPINKLFQSFEGLDIPDKVMELSQGLEFRDFITVGILVEKLNSRFGNTDEELTDNWIYIHDPEVDVCRIQIFNNWSEYMVNDRNKFWIGLEYICSNQDEIWNMSDDQIIQKAINEIELIGMANSKDVIDYTVIKVEKTYPAYWGTYKEFNEIRKYVDKIDNLFLIGRNGMHKYNNQDHSMLTAMEAVGNIISKTNNKDNIWAVNTEDEYIEKKS